MSDPSVGLSDRMAQMEDRVQGIERHELATLRTLITKLEAQVLAQAAEADEQHRQINGLWDQNRLLKQTLETMGQPKIAEQHSRLCDLEHKLKQAGFEERRMLNRMLSVETALRDLLLALNGATSNALGANPA